MKIALIGASGFVGTALLREMTDRGHEVTAIARHPEKLAVRNPHVHPAAGDVMNTQHLVTLLKGKDAVVSAFNPGWTNPRIYEDFISGSRAILDAVRESGVKRFIVIGGAGSLEVRPGVQLIDTPQFPAEFKRGAMGARDFLNELRQEKELDWTYFSPAILMNHEHSGERRGEYRLGLDSPVFDEKGQSVLSVEDLAMAIVDELEHRAHIKQRFTAGY